HGRNLPRGAAPWISQDGGGEGGANGAGSSTDARGAGSSTDPAGACPRQDRARERYIPADADDAQDSSHVLAQLRRGVAADNATVTGRGRRRAARFDAPPLVEGGGEGVRERAARRSHGENGGERHARVLPHLQGLATRRARPPPLRARARLVRRGVLLRDRREGGRQGEGRGRAVGRGGGAARGG
ncbi:hypothetical protein T484DRAFT_1912633, partial [Baffinella frigidus]